MTLKFSGTFQDLAAKLEELNGQWDESQPNKKVLRLNDGVMNWFETTGTINFQGKGKGKIDLENQVPKLLYPAEASTIGVSKMLVETQERSSTLTKSTETSSIE